MIYKVEIDSDEFKSRQIRKRAEIQEVSEEEILMREINKLVLGRFEEWIQDELNGKLTTMSSGKALALLEAMD